jgi:hypothetical protein
MCGDFHTFIHAYNSSLVHGLFIKLITNCPGWRRRTGGENGK